VGRPRASIPPLWKFGGPGGIISRACFRHPSCGCREGLEERPGFTCKPCVAFQLESLLSSNRSLSASNPLRNRGIQIASWEARYPPPAFVERFLMIMSLRSDATTQNVRPTAVCAMSKGDLQGVVAVHLRSFPHSFLSELGSVFLTCLYDEIMRDPSGIALVFRTGSRVDGFVAGTSQPLRFYRRLLLRRWYRFAFAAALPALSNPRMISRLLNAFRKPREEADYADCGLLMSLAVDPSCQGGDVGRTLVSSFLDVCRARSLKLVHLTTDHLNNDRVNAFYQKLGFRLHRTFATPQGRLMNDYRASL
jgi:GNAT superfamily N-acetyltransferase